MSTRILDKSDKVNVIDEYKINDRLFNSIAFGSSSPLENDIEYKKPLIKTWAYTNIRDYFVWMKESDLMFKVPFNTDIFTNLNYYDKGVVIVKTVNFKIKNRADYSEIIKGMFANNVFSEDVKTKLVERLRSFKDGEIKIGFNETIRFVYIIKESELEEFNKVKINNIFISANYDYLLGVKQIDTPKQNDYNSLPAVELESAKPKHAHNHNESIMENGDINPSNMFDFRLTYNSVSGNDMELELLGTDILLKGSGEIINTKGIDKFDTVSLWNVRDGNISLISSIERQNMKEVKKLEVENEEQKDDEEDVEVEEGVSELVDLFKLKYQLESDAVKFIQDHHVSLHKLFSYIVKEEAAIKALEKEEIATAKEFMKLISGFK